MSAPRYVPDQPLPPYAFVPGRFPHPTRDPRGHSYGMPARGPEAPDPETWRSCRPYLYGVDLFNHGYYWEAHEVWEELWRACPCPGPARQVLHGLIRLSAAGVKALEGNARGVRRHAGRAAALLQESVAAPGGPGARYMGLPIADIVQSAAELAAAPAPRLPAAAGAAEPALGLILRLV